MKIMAWGVSDPGKRRTKNEDGFIIDERLGLFVVADGMGGHQGGAVASRLALDAIHRFIAESSSHLAEAAARILAMSSDDLVTTRDLNTASDISSSIEITLDSVAEARARLERAPTAPMPAVTDMLHLPPAVTVIRAAVIAAGNDVFDAALTNPQLRGMGTTVTAMFCADGHIHLAHAGDSRAYLFRDNRLEQLTEDHSWIAEQVRMGNMTQAEAKSSRYRHVITRSVGFERDVEVDVHRMPIQAGDCFLLCSDGMYMYIDESELEHLLQMMWLRQAPELLKDLANDRGGEDNITVVVVLAANDDDASTEQAAQSVSTNVSV